MKKFIKTTLLCIIIGTLITFGVLKFVDYKLYHFLQSSYLEVDTYRTSSLAEIKSTDLISIPDNAELLQFSYNNKYYTYLEEGRVHVYSTDTKEEVTVVEEDYPICYYYLAYDKNLILYFIEDTNGSYTSITAKNFDIATERKTSYYGMDIDVYNFSRIKDITMSPLLSIIYLNIETKSGFGTSNTVYMINLFNDIGQVRSGSILTKIRMLQHVNRLYYQDTDGGVYSTAYGTINNLFNYADVELIGIDSRLATADDDEKLYLLNTETKDRVYVVSNRQLIDTIMLTDTDVVTWYNDYNDVYLVYPTYILNLTGKNPYKRIAKLSKYVKFEAIKGDMVYLRTSNNKIISTKLLDN